MVFHLFNPRSRFALACSPEFPFGNRGYGYHTRKALCKRKFRACFLMQRPVLREFFDQLSLGAETAKARGFPTEFSDTCLYPFLRVTELAPFRDPSIPLA